MLNTHLLSRRVMLFLLLGLSSLYILLWIVCASKSLIYYSSSNKKAIEPTATAIATNTVPDLNRLMNLKEFWYTMIQPACNSSVEALIMVHSKPQHRQQRKLIRDTWGGKILQGTPFRIIFLLAKTSMDIQDSLWQENDLYGDILQGTFTDSYKHITYKHAMALKWFTYNCAHAQLLIKVDDDIMLNTPLLLLYWRAKRQGLKLNSTGVYHKLRDDSETPLELNAAAQLFSHPQNLIFCQRDSKGVVRRSFRSTWRISFKVYSKPYYPANCPGFGIIYSADVVFRLYGALQNASYFWIDDVLITGMLRERLKLNITTALHYVLRSTEIERAFDRHEYSKIREAEFIFTSDRYKNVNTLAVLWKHMLQYYSIYRPMAHTN